MPTFKFNLLFDDSMPMGIMEKKLFMENHNKWIVLNIKLGGTAHSEEKIQKAVQNLVHLASVIFQKNKTRASNIYLSKNVFKN